MSLFDLVEKHHGIGLAADLLCQLTGLVIAHVARGRAYYPGNGKLFHKLGHIKPYKVFRGIEKIRGEALNKLGFAHAGAAHKDKAHGLALGLQAHAAAADGGAHGVHRLVLTHDVGFQPVAQSGQPLKFVLPDAGGGDLGPQLYYAGHIVHGQLRPPLGFQSVQLATQLYGAGANLRQTLIVLVLGVLHKELLLPAQIAYLLFHRFPAGKGLVFKINVRAGLVDKVDGLIRQKAVGYIPLRHGNGHLAHLVGYDDLMIILVIVLDALYDLHGIGNGGFVHRDRLEAALQRGVLFYMLAVLGKGGGADDLNLAPGKGGLEDIGGVHAALGVPGAHDVVDLVDNKDNVALLAYLVNKPLHAAFKLAAELSAGHQRGEVEKIDLLILQLIGHLTFNDALGQPFGNGGFAHARLADKAGVIFLAAVEYLYHPLQLLLPAYHGVQLAVSCPLVEVDAVIIKKLLFPRSAPLLILRGLLGGALLLGLILILGAVLGAEKPVEEGECGGLALILRILAVSVGVGVGIYLHKPIHAGKGVHHIS